MTDELKPVRCGCGGEAVTDYLIGEPSEPISWYVYCKKCETETNWYDTEAEAITAWNKAMSGNVQKCAKDAQCSERTTKVTYRSTTMGLSFCCGNCGKPVHSECEYCHHCGARLEWE